MERVLDMQSLRVEKAIKAIAKHTPAKPVTGIILGSGQGGFSHRLASAEYIPYQSIPFFFQPIVPGHEGIMSIGNLNDRPVVVLEGRIHLYEGYFMREIVFPIRVLQHLGVRDIIICNAAGGISKKFSTGQVMIVTDHINLMGTNPLIGQIHQEYESPFLSMSEVYNSRLRELAREAGAEMGEELVEGILAAVVGPCYETPAESRMLSLLGADAVTMSTIPEVIMARYLGMRVLGLSLLTNIHDAELDMDHQEVVKVARGRTSVLMELIVRIVSKMAAPATDDEKGIK